MTRYEADALRLMVSQLTMPRETKRPRYLNATRSSARKRLRRTLYSKAGNSLWAYL